MAIECSLKNYEESEIHRKKILALRNYSETLPHFEEWCVLEILVRYLEQGNIPRKLHHIIDDLLELHNLDYTQWWIKNDWVRQQIDSKMDGDKNTVYFDFYYEIGRKNLAEFKNSTFMPKIYPNRNLNMETNAWI